MDLIFNIFNKYDGDNINGGKHPAIKQLGNINKNLTLLWHCSVSSLWMGCSRWGLRKEFIVPKGKQEINIRLSTTLVCNTPRLTLSILMINDVMQFPTKMVQHNTCTFS